MNLNFSSEVDDSWLPLMEDIHTKVCLLFSIDVIYVCHLKLKGTRIAFMRYIYMFYM